MPPAVAPRPPGEELPEERDPIRRLRLWLAVVTVLAIAAAGAAGYAISEIESTKDENREDDQAVSALRADLDVAREQLGERIEGLETRVEQAADESTQRRLQNDLEALEKRVTRLDRQDDGGESDQITNRVDDLEQRIEDLEDADTNTNDNN